MLWLNPSTGDVIDAPKRPSPAWVAVVGVKISNQEVESTLEGLRRAMMKSDAYTLRPNDFEWVEKTGLNVYAHEAWWLKTITDADFPYLKMAIASDGTLEIRYDEKAKDDTSKDTIRTKEISEDDSPLKRGGQRGTGKSGKGSGEGYGGGGQGEPAPNGDEPSEEPSDEPTEPAPEPSEDRDAYQEGQESADSISDDLKEKMKEKMQEKGKPAEESGPSSGPAPDGSEGGAPAEDSTGEAGQGTGDGQGTPSQGDGDSGSGDGQGDGDGDGSDGDNGGDSDSCDSSDGGNEASCDNPSEDGDAQPTDDPQDVSGDDGDSDSDSSDSNQESSDSNNQESGDKGEKDGKDGKSDEAGDTDSADSGDESGDSDSPGLPPEDEDALQQCVEEAEDARDSAEEAMQNADSEEALKEADRARDAADEAHDIVDAHEMENEGNDPLDNEKVQEAMDYADEAEEFAQLAKELEEEIQELFDNSGLDEEDYEDFKQGLLDELFGEDSEFVQELSEREKRLQDKIKRREANKSSRGLVRCVNWQTGEIKSFPENETIGDTWIQITKFFSPFETKEGKQIVVDRTIAGAVEMAKELGIKVLHSDKKEAKFESDKADFVEALKKMRMFQVRSTRKIQVRTNITNPFTEITY